MTVSSLKTSFVKNFQKDFRGWETNPCFKTCVPQVKIIQASSTTRPIINRVQDKRKELSSEVPKENEVKETQFF